MKNKVIRMLSLALCISATTKLSAQMDNRINGDPAAFKMLSGRTVVVEVKDEDPNMIAALSKNKKDPDGVKHYKDFIASNNKMLKQAVDKYWKFNAKIEYKSTGELNSLIGKSSDYVILSYMTVNGTTYQGPQERARMDPTTAYSMPTIWYYRSEKTDKQEPDNFMYLPVASIPDEQSPECWGYVQSDYDFAVKQLQDNINYIISNNKKVLYIDYAKKISEANCGKIQSQTLVIDKNQLDEKADQASVTSFYKGPVDFTDGKSDATFESAEKGKEVIFSFAYGIASGGGGIGAFSFSNSALYFCKAVVDCNTGELMYFYSPPSGMGMGSATTYQYQLRKYLFYYMGKCK